MATVMVDLDDTLADTTAVLLQHVNRKADRPYRYDDLTRAYRESNQGGYFELVREVLDTGDRLAFEPLTDALEGVRRLAREGHHVHIASARRENQHQLTHDWLAEHGFAEFVSEVHPRSSEMKGVEFKRGVARRIKAAAVFDDTYTVAETLAPVCPVYLIDAPWNREEGLPDSVIRVPSFAAGVDRFLQA